MANDYASAVRAGAMAAGRFLREINVIDSASISNGSINVFNIIDQLEIPLLFRPLKGLLGAFLNSPMPGILVTSERRLSIQRFTAAHELGHFVMKHHLSLDDERTILKRAPAAEESASGFQETEANAFAVAFMMPKWLVTDHCIRRGWTKTHLEDPRVVYQLSLRLGASYEATCRTLASYKLIQEAVLSKLLSTPRRSIKAELLGNYKPVDFKRDVWVLTEHDRGARLEGSNDDCFIIRLSEHASAGFVWDFNQLVESGFLIVDDTRVNLDADGIGGDNLRAVTAVAHNKPSGQIQVFETRPWRRDESKGFFEFEFDLTGPEPLGLSRAERLRAAEAA